MRTLLSALFAGVTAYAAAFAGTNLVSSEFIYEAASFPQCHASTIVEVKDGFVAAWFGGTREGAADVRIWTARQQGGKWTAPVAVADGVEGTNRYPTWNPVLFHSTTTGARMTASAAAAGELLLFYKAGPSPSRWWGMVMRSDDAGRTWSKPERLPEGILGPIKNKPVQLAGGDLLCPSSTEHDGWRVRFERLAADTARWQLTPNVADFAGFSAIQPSILLHSNGVLQALCRSKKQKVVQSWSRDGGRTWSELEPTPLPNPNSGIDAVTLKDGRHVLVYNHTAKGRYPLNVAISSDGRSWTPLAVLETEPGEYSYPAVIQSADGLVHIVYTWHRKRIRHVVLAP